MGGIFEERIQYEQRMFPSLFGKGVLQDDAAFQPVQIGKPLTQHRNGIIHYVQDPPYNSVCYMQSRSICIENSTGYHDQ